MRTLLFSLLLQIPGAFEPAHLKEIVPIRPVFNITAPSWVIADLDIGIDGRVHLPDVLKGEEPVRSSALSSMTEWLFAPARTTAPVESHVTAVCLFRPRDVFSAPPPDLSDMPPAETDSGPTPISLSDPAYPVMSISEGVIVLELQVSETGSVQTVRVINGIPGLTKFTEEAVRAWKFNPAKQSGQPVPGTAIAVISYLLPAIT